MLLNIIHDHLRKDRFDLMINEIIQEELIPFRIWDAVKKYPKPKQNISEAHRNIVQWAKETGQEECLISEDDCHWMPNGFKYFLSKKPKEYDLYLSSVLNGRIDGFGNLSGTVTGFQGYMVHKNFYDRFLAADPNVDIDHAIMKANYKAENKAKIICCYPFATMEHNTFSDNQKKFHDLKKLYHDRKFWEGQ